MKKFVHKLEGLIKYYSFLEYEAKIELGKVNKKIQKINEDLVEYTNYIDNTLLSSESFTNATNIKGAEIQIFPFVIKDLRAHVSYLLKEKEKLLPEYNDKLKILNERKAKLDLVLKMKDKANIIYKKKESIKALDDILENSIVHSMIYSNNKGDV